MNVVLVGFCSIHLTLKLKTPFFTNQNIISHKSRRASYGSRPYYLDILACAFSFYTLAWSVLSILHKMN